MIYAHVLLTHTHTNAHEQGPITRIASGCSDEEVAALEKAYAKMDGGRGKFRLHATPDFSVDEKTGKKYYFYNSASHSLWEAGRQGRLAGTGDGARRVPMV